SGRRAAAGWKQCRSRRRARARSAPSSPRRPGPSQRRRAATRAAHARALPTLGPERTPPLLDALLYRHIVHLVPLPRLDVPGIAALHVFLAVYVKLLQVAGGLRRHI